jgi:CheY-like chemotaxis protein
MFAESALESKHEMSEAPRTVLIVDDDPAILRLVEKMLKHRRVTVVAVPQPADALQISATQTIHLLISDVAMPEMDGNKLANRFLKLQPDAAVLLISGHYRDNEPPANSARMRFLPKPFFPSDLLAHLRELLPD